MIEVSVDQDWCVEHYVYFYKDEGCPTCKYEEECPICKYEEEKSK